ncbi:hypothetical protein G6F32_015392 [Rhizopus arrhizus]|nr:hypothetical protein G6F32_015392 [Rhizopus arrhizus]
MAYRNLPIVLFVLSGKLVRQLGGEPQERQPDQDRDKAAIEDIAHVQEQHPDRGEPRPFAVAARLAAQRQGLLLGQFGVAEPFGQLRRGNRRRSRPAEFGLTQFARQFQRAGLVVGDLGRSYSFWYSLERQRTLVALL